LKFTVAVDEREGVTTVALSGELDLETAEDLERGIRTLIADGHSRVVVDLRELTFCDSVGLNTLVRASKHCEEAAGWLRVVHPTGQVADVLRIAGLYDFLSSGSRTAEEA
jgi:anti-anti-sigma factor